MTKLIRSLILSAITVSILTSCSLFSNNSTQSQLIQATPALPSVVTIELTVQVDTSIPFNAVGQIIKYNYNVKNTGTISTPGPITVPGATCPAINTVGNLDTALDPNEIVTCTSNYTITQADLDKGSVTNIVTAAVNSINSNPVTTKIATVPPVILKLTKTANPVNYNQVGQTITYTYVITNSGATTLGPAQFIVTDLGISAPINCGGATTTLAPNATVTCTATYTVTQVNLDAGSVVTSATASGGGVVPSQPTSATITKGSVVQPNSNPANLTVGSTIQHQVVDGEWLWQIARCYGADPEKVIQANPQLSNPAQISPNTTVTVPNIGSAGKIYGIPCIGTYTVQSGDTWSSIALKYNADSTVLQMVNSNTLTVGKVLKVPLNSAGSVIPVSSITPASKALSLTTTANPLTYNAAGQVITFTYIIKNSGATNLGPAQFIVSPNITGSTPINCGDANTSLAPNATVTCNIPYTITDINLTANSVTNQVTALGGGAGPSQVASVTINKDTKALTLTMTANPINYGQAGQVITFTYVIKNSGNGNLGPAQFTVSPSITGSTPINCGDANTSLAPNATMSCNIPYTITDINLTANILTNQATASGGGAGPSQPASVTINKQ